MYHYEKLADILYRIAVIFEPPQEIIEPERIIKVPKRKYTKRSEKFPLGDAILKILSTNDPGITMGEIINITKTPRPYSRSIWGAVVGKLVKKGKVRCNHNVNEKGIREGLYRRVK
jgi:hypothetical protein